MKKIILFLFLISTYCFSQSYYPATLVSTNPITVSYSANGVTQCKEVTNGPFNFNANYAYFSNYTGNGEYSYTVSGAGQILYLTTAKYVNAVDSSWYGNYYDAVTVSCPVVAPTCNAVTEVLNTTTNLCVPALGYHADSNGISVPDVDCPNPMIYSVTPAWHGYWATDKRCVPDKNLTKSQCDSIPGAVFGTVSDANEKTSLNALMYGEGCTNLAYSKSMFTNDGVSDVLHFIPFSPLWNSNNDLVVQSIDKLFGVGKNLFNTIKSKFANSTLSPKPNLSTYEPEIIDMAIGSDGVTYDVVLNAKTPDKTNPNGWWDTYQKFRTNGWDFPETPSNYNPAFNDYVPPTVNTPKFPIVGTSLDDLVYKGSDATSFNNNMIGTANMSKDAVVPDLSPLSSSTINKQVDTTITLNSSLFGTTTQSYPTVLVKDTEIALSDRVESTYKGYTVYPDGSKTFLDISRTKYNVDGHTIDNVTTKTDIPTSIGTKVMNTSYQAFTDGNGVLTSSVNAPTSIITDSASGTVTSTNVASNPIITSSSAKAVDLTPVISKLSSIDSKVQTIIDTPIPKEIAEATVRIQDFNSAVNVFAVDFSTYKDYASSLIDNINQLKTNFDHTKAILENKPTVNEITGTCGFNASFFQGQNIFVDPCMFVAPYRPILALIFTLMGTFSVLGFSVKYLVAKGD